MKNCSNFVRSSKQLIHILDFISDHNLIGPRLADTAIAIAHNWNKRQNIYPSQQTIAERINVKSTRTVRTYITELKELGLIDYHQPKAHDNKHRSNNYSFNYEMLSKLYIKAKKLAAKLKAELVPVVDIPQNDDPAPLDPPITSSLRSEEQKDLYITETAPLVSTSFIDFLKLDALGNELKHIGKLKQASVLKRIQGIETKRQLYIKSLFADQDRKRRETTEQLERIATERNQQQEALTGERNALSAALMSWNLTGNGFTRKMYERLVELNKGTLNGMEGFVAKKFLAS